MAEWPASSAADTLPQSDVGGRDLFFFPSLFLFPLQMHGGLIKRCGPARLMGLIAYYAGPYIMSNRLLLSLPVNEASRTSMGGKGSSDCLEKDKTMCHSCPIPREIVVFFLNMGSNLVDLILHTEPHSEVLYLLKITYRCMSSHSLISSPVR